MDMGLFTVSKSEKGFIGKQLKALFICCLSKGIYPTLLIKHHSCVRLRILFHKEVLSILSLLNMMKS